MEPKRGAKLPPSAVPGRRPLDMGADAAKVRPMMEYLVRCFEEYVSEHDTAHIDAFMAVHNFHKAIVLDLIQRSEMDEATGRFFRTMAATTFDEAMRRGR